MSKAKVVKAKVSVHTHMKVLNQRDCLVRYFDIYGEKYFPYESLPNELVEILDEIKQEKRDG